MIWRYLLRCMSPELALPEEATGTGKVRSLGMTGRVENVPLPPSLTRGGP